MRMYSLSLWIESTSVRCAARSTTRPNQERGPLLPSFERVQRIDAFTLGRYIKATVSDCVYV
jgi:hypothetical protein